MKNGRGHQQPDNMCQSADLFKGFIFYISGQGTAYQMNNLSQIEAIYNQSNYDVNLNIRDILIYLIVLNSPQNGS
jgi:hypothetical protein